MTSEESKHLLLSLLHAESEDEVESILREYGYWDDPSVWRLYGDKEGNYSIAGSQQATPEGALVEKLVNSIDATLLRECLRRNIDPESSAAPDSITNAVGKFFNSEDSAYRPGDLRDWGQKKITEQAKEITLCATGSRKETNLTISDLGEGQTPRRVPETILSLNKKNKQRIRFVQGKFNMGGTGVLRHCGKRSFQLVLTKRHPHLVKLTLDTDKCDAEWGFTIVRRERPSGQAGDPVHSEFKYLAPRKIDDEQHVLSFSTDTLEILPHENEPYSRPARSGTLIKLYNYDLSAGSSNILMKDGLLYRLETLLPGAALPMRIHECRKHFRGAKSRSFETNLSGLNVRLESGRSNNLEHEPWDVPFTVRGLDFSARIYVFKKRKKETYMGKEGVLFVINGQTHGVINRNIFSRTKRVGLQRLSRDLLVIVDCSNLPVDAREDLFMSSRDRLSDGELRKALESQLEDILRNDSLLRELSKRRQDSDISERLNEQRPLQDVLQGIINQSPGLSALFDLGKRLSVEDPKKSSKSKSVTGENSTGGDVSGSGKFIGNTHPSYFRFSKKPKSTHYDRTAEVGRRVRERFETDAENGYFTRPSNRGRYRVEILEDDIESYDISHHCDLHDGVAQWSLLLPERVEPGRDIKLKLIVEDDVILQPIVNFLTIHVIPKADRDGGQGDVIRRKGEGSKARNSRSAKSQFELPSFRVITSEDEEWSEYDFNGQTGCVGVDDATPEEAQEGLSKLVFYVNGDNVYLKEEMKKAPEPELVRAKFSYANVLVGLAVARLRQEESDKWVAAEDMPAIDEKYSEYTRLLSTALSPFLIPMIDSLGGLSALDIDLLAD